MKSIGEYDGALRVRLCAVPVEGAANAELIKTLAKAFGVTPSHVSVVGGQASKHKRVCIGKIDTERAAEIIRTCASVS